ncbi:MAG TPA: hypothetical protein PLX97_02850 [Gemmatales bacterium]|nr:hypothetical protein [Gemmatales bacterium]
MDGIIEFELSLSGMVMNQLSDSQIFCGIREVLYSDFWITVDIDANTNIIDLVNHDSQFDEYDFLDVLYRIARFFRFTCDKSEWLDFFSERNNRSFDEWKQQLTFGALARFIAQRAGVNVSFKPLLMLDKPCASAGIFLGIQTLAHQEIRGCMPFAPSTPILEVMRGKQLQRFWGQLRWMTSNAIPPLPAFWKRANEFAVWTGLLVFLLGVFSVYATGDAIWISTGFVLAVMLYLAASLYKRLVNPLPTNMLTFRDLVKWIASTENRTEASASPLPI